MWVDKVSRNDVIVTVLGVECFPYQNSLRSLTPGLISFHDLETINQSRLPLKGDSTDGPQFWITDVYGVCVDYVSCSDAIFFFGGAKIEQSVSAIASNYDMYTTLHT